MSARSRTCVRALIAPCISPITKVRIGIRYLFFCFGGKNTKNNLLISKFVDLLIYIVLIIL